MLELLQSRAEYAPQQTALLEPGRRPASYADVLRQVMVVGQRLRDAGVTRTDTVALALPNGSDLAVAVLGTVAAAVCAPLAPDQPRAALENQLVTLRPRLLIVMRGYATDG